MHDIDSVPSNVQSASREALLYVYLDNEAVIKMIKKGRGPTMRHVSRTHRVLIDWMFDRIKSGHQNPNQIHRHQKPIRWHINQREFHTWWVQSFVVLVQYQSFQFYSVSDTMTKRSQRDSGEERVTVKSRPMTNLIARTSSYVSSSTSVNPMKRIYRSQDPCSSVAKKDERSGRPDIGTDKFKVSDHYYMSNFWKASLQ